MAELAAHWRYLEGEWEAARTAPLSLRRAMLVAALIDAYVDRLFAAAPDEDDILAFRAGMRADPSLALIFDLCAQRPDGPRLAIEAVTVPLADYGALGVEDFMVSLYNDHTVSRVMIVHSDGTRREAQRVLEEALKALGRQ